MRDLATSSPRPRPLIVAGVLLGVGLGGFFDGILLHQLLQWHSMMSSVVPPVDLPSMHYNMRWDGAFHAVTWAVTLAGVVALFRAARRPEVPWSGAVLLGGGLLGWGGFNLVEGTVNHLILGIHHVHPQGDVLAWDLGFLAFGAALAAAGWGLVHRDRRRRALPGPSPLRPSPAMW
jgi:uncharacterized membrane protein